MKTPQYRQLHQLLKKQILAGEFQEGDLLPSENELSAAHNITRATVRQALEELVKEKYIYKHKGRGSVVSSQRKTLGLLSFRGFSEVAEAAHLTVKTVVLQKPVLVSWEDDFFYPLSKAEKAAGCIFLERLRCADQDPVMLEYTYIPNIGLPDFLQHSLVHDSLFETLHVQYDIEIMNVEQDIRAIAAVAETARQLKLSEGSPVLHIYRRYGTSRKGFYLYSSLFCNTTQYALSNSFDS